MSHEARRTVAIGTAVIAIGAAALDGANHVFDFLHFPSIQIHGSIGKPEVETEYQALVENIQLPEDMGIVKGEVSGTTSVDEEPVSNIGIGIGWVLNNTINTARGTHGTITSTGPVEINLPKSAVEQVKPYSFTPQNGKGKGYGVEVDVNVNKLELDGANITNTSHNFGNGVIPSFDSVFSGSTGEASRATAIANYNTSTLEVACGDSVLAGDIKSGVVSDMKTAIGFAEEFQAAKNQDAASKRITTSERLSSSLGNVPVKVVLMDGDVALTNNEAISLPNPSNYVSRQQFLSEMGENSGKKVSTSSSITECAGSPVAIGQDLSIQESYNNQLASASTGAIG
jgi:hypothetical protein